jgi:hypothetical protein
MKSSDDSGFMLRVEPSLSQLPDATTFGIIAYTSRAAHLSTSRQKVRLLISTILWDLARTALKSGYVRASGIAFRLSLSAYPPLESKGQACS